MVSGWNCSKYFCVFFYCNHQAQRDVLITLYMLEWWCSSTYSYPRQAMQFHWEKEKTLPSLLESNRYSVISKPLAWSLYWPRNWWGGTDTATKWYSEVHLTAPVRCKDVRIILKWILSYQFVSVWDWVRLVQVAVQWRTAKLDLHKSKDFFFWPVERYSDVLDFIHPKAYYITGWFRN
jgi:hypothetical protein